jgi:hypothetical protein
MVSVLLPVYNAQETVGRAIQSILRQTFEEFELLVINDGSRDGSLEVVKRFQDPRIRVIDLTRNGGLVSALNYGLDVARGELIARQDADDESMSRRLELQCAALSKDARLLAVGAALQIMRNGRRSGEVWRYPATAVAARWQSLFKTPVAHSAVTFRRDSVVGVGGYLEDYRYAEDYELWSRLLQIGNIESLSESLLKYDVGMGGVSRAKANEQRIIHCRIAGSNMRRLINAEIENKVVDSLAFGLESGATFGEFSEFLSAAKCLALLYRKFLEAERTQQDESVPGEVRIDLEERACKLVRMLPYRHRFSGLNAMIEAMPRKSISRRSMARLLCLP